LKRFCHQLLLVTVTQKRFVMRRILLLFALTLLSTAITAQFVITPGAQVHMTGTAQLTLENMNLVNNGGLVTYNSRITFSGNSNFSIAGANPVQFYDLEIAKNNGASVVLLGPINVSNRILFTLGLLDISHHDVNLGAGAYLDGEHENSRITSLSDGKVVVTATLNAPSAANPGNLGAIITSAQNMGTVTIRRGHQSQTNSSGLGSSIRRNYDISPANNSGLNATLRIQYLNAELNALNESSLVFFRTDDGTNWIPQGFSARNTVLNWVERTNINSFRSWTLSAAGNALPVEFSLFNVKCDGGAALITWRTAQEQNTNRFEVQKSADGLQWTVAGALPAAGNSGIERNYSFTDNNSQNSYYRIAAHDNDGKIKYTSVLRSPCSSKDVFKVWPNPVQRTLFVNIVAEESSTANIKVMDSKGAVMKEQRATVLQGSNQFSVDLGMLPKGMYTVFAEWKNGQHRSTTQILKQ
jgi:hypothetical protein